MLSLLRITGSEENIIDLVNYFRIFGIRRLSSRSEAFLEILDRLILISFCVSNICQFKINLGCYSRVAESRLLQPAPYKPRKLLIAVHRFKYIFAEAFQIFILLRREGILVFQFITKECQNLKPVHVILRIH